MEFAKTFMDDGIYRFFVYIYVIELTRACMGSVFFLYIPINLPNYRFKKMCKVKVCNTKVRCVAWTGMFFVESCK